MIRGACSNSQATGMSTIETERLTLRPLCEGDAEEISRMHSDPDVVAYIPEGEDLCEVAYLIARDHWGRGFATEAAQALVQHGFEVMGEDLLVSLINRENQRSVRVAIKAGMKLLKEFPYMYKYGIYRDPARETGRDSD